jgi:hypothetical protein
VSAKGVDGRCDNYSASPARPAEQAEPELLPWRTRLKTRLGARLFHHGESGSQQYPDESVIVSADDSSRLSPLLVAPPNPPENPSVTKKSTPSGKTAELQVPKTALLKLESTRPDLVME